MLLMASLTSLDLNSFITSKVTSMIYMFKGCSKLKNLDLSNFVTSSVENIGIYVSWLFKLVCIKHWKF